MIFIHKNDSTVFADQDKFLTFHIKTDKNLTGWKAEFVLCSVKKVIEDISTKTFEVILSAKDTSKLYYGKPFGELRLIDKNGNIKTIANNIPFCVTKDIVENESQSIELNIPESAEIEISVSYQAPTGSTTNYEELENIPSINGVELIGDKSLDELGIQPKGEYLEEHQDISHLASKKELADGLETKQPKGNYIEEHQDISHLASKKELSDGLDTKQPKGDYALKSEMPDTTNFATKTELNNKQDKGNYALKSDIPDVSNYLENQANFPGALAIGENNTISRNSVALGLNNEVQGQYSTTLGSNNYSYNDYNICIGEWCDCNGQNSICIGYEAMTAEENSIQLGQGFNFVPNSFQVFEHQLLDNNTGLIPDERISSNIARLSDIPQGGEIDTSNLATKQELTSGLNTKQDVLTAGENITIENNVISANVPQSGGEVEINVSAPIVYGGLQTSIDNISVDNNGKCYLNLNAYYATIEECLPTAPIVGLESPRSSFYDSVYNSEEANLSFYKLKGYTDKYPILNLEGYNAILHNFAIGDIVMADSIKSYDGDTHDVQMCFGRIEDDGLFIPKLICMTNGWGNYRFAKVGLLFTPSKAYKYSQQMRYASPYIMEYSNYKENGHYGTISYKKQDSISNIENIRGVKFIEKDGAVSVAWVRESGEVVELSDSGTFAEIDFNCVVFNGYCIDVEKEDIGIYGFDSSKYYVAKDTIDNVVVRMTDGTGFSAYSLNYEKEDFTVVDNKLSLKTKMQLITQTDYDSLETKDSNTLYLIEE